MSQPPGSSSDFTPEVPTPPQKRSTPVVLWVLGGLGCGCLGLFALGIISAIALPSFLNQANKAREAEAKAYVGSLLRAQQAYFIERGEFSPDIAALEVGINPETENYSYSLAPGDDGASVYVFAEPKESSTKGFAGAAYAVGESPATATTFTGICAGDEPGRVPPSPPALDIDLAEPEVVCPPGSSDL